ncbi:Glutamate decarboxylase 1, partial [Eudyptula minor novaehollandiae]
LLPAKNGKGFTEQFLLEVVEILLSYSKRTYDGEKVLDFHHPHQLLEGLERFSLEHFRREILLGDRHPRYLNQFSSGLDIISPAGEWLTAIADTNMFTYEMAPVFPIMEQIFLKKMHERIGW